MKEQTKRYWKGTEELSNDPEFIKKADQEFPEYLPLSDKNQGNGLEGNSRRDFLKMMGFGVAAASLAACEAPVRKAIPYLNKPVEVDPGIPNYYASTYYNQGNYHSIVVKTREGRPIKVESNPFSKASSKGVSAQVEASVLSLYDKERLNTPLKEGEELSWDQLDADVMAALKGLSPNGIRIVSNTIISPSTLKAIQKFQEQYPGAELITYDALSQSGTLKANERSFGAAVLPSYDLTKAQTIVSVNADFLGAWSGSTGLSRQYADGRKLGKNKKSMSRHYQFESNLSVTGSNADYRVGIRPSQEGLIIAAFYNLIARKAGQSTINTAAVEVKHLEKAANELWSNRGKSLLIAGSNDPDIQVLVNAVNSLLGNYGKTIDITKPFYTRKGDDVAMGKFISDLKGGRVSGVIFYNANPVYDHPMGAELGEAIEKSKLSISTASTLDETAALCQYVAPDHHYLESWNDANPQLGEYSLAQPTISNIFSTRQGQHSFLTWAGVESDYYQFLKDEWRKTLFANQSKYLDFEMFWDATLHDGVYFAEQNLPEGLSAEFKGDVSTAGRGIARNYKADNEGLELMLYPTVAIGSGAYGNNPWLHEMPDPVTKACWDNYLTISQKMANDLGIKMVEGKTSLLNLKVGDQTMKVPAMVQPGQAANTVGLALGYGRTKAGKVGNEVGVNAYPLVKMINGYLQLGLTEEISIENTKEPYTLAHTQTHHTYMGRKFVVQEAKLEDYKKDPQAGRYSPKIATKDGAKAPSEVSLWKGHEYPIHHWGMVIDLNSCTGCGSCTVACQVENNIPVVGKQEVINRRDMHWIRIDRYYSSDGDPEDNRALEIAADNPEVTFQPMMCQQCNNAPCETVCPVAATTHSSEGLNQMTYNRCIGTRYCANNCPYKVRRFNWFKYHDNKQFAGVNLAMNDDLGKMVLNPDVTVRARGVMEKCTFCVQRIQSGKLAAKKEGRKIKDGEVEVACASACPTSAIVFGDLNDTSSRVRTLLEEEKEGRSYHVLEELNVSPNVWYLTKIRNKDKVSQEA